MINTFTKDKKVCDEFLAGFVLTILMILSLLSCKGMQPNRAETSFAHAGEPRIVIADLERQIHNLINSERRRHGLHLLQWDDKLARIARQHSNDMAKRNYFAHESPEGHDFSYRFQQEGYRCSISVGAIRYLGAENILQTYLYASVSTVKGNVFYDWNSQEKIAKTTVQGWMNSVEHRMNILTPYWNNEGIGAIVAPDGKVYITQNFC